MVEVLSFGEATRLLMAKRGIHQKINGGDRLSVLQRCLCVLIISQDRSQTRFSLRLISPSFSTAMRDPGSFSAHRDSLFFRKASLFAKRMDGPNAGASLNRTVSERDPIFDVRTIFYSKRRPKEHSRQRVGACFTSRSLDVHQR